MPARRQSVKLQSVVVSVPSHSVTDSEEASAAEKANYKSPGIFYRAISGLQQQALGDPRGNYPQPDAPFPFFSVVPGCEWEGRAGQWRGETGQCFTPTEGAAWFSSQSPTDRPN
ncbi:hypothetical protein DPEC_G00023960 [Dallia pectoralis]|uniref:Uncharacterized protein n=1 Tax=Dallia pectoralis TaxID=75939 RepID=A0ACC2HGX1_DALPE|nr:hypothetical protein DPEC_G00023960 [Dallia pectoralis]